MNIPVSLVRYALGELFATAYETGCLTLADRYGLMAAIFDESISDDEKQALDRLLRAVSRGQIKAIDELSVIQLT
ncbi:MAG: hypothetical protein ACRC8A_04515 [Microcoleaceae cyanobacterium]